jgi:hypothetical protein
VTIQCTFDAHTPESRELGSSDFNLTPQYIDVVQVLVALLEKLLCCPAGLSDFVPQLLRNRRAREKVRTNTLGQISTTLLTEKRANAGWF